MKNFEIILINDLSFDNSLKIIRNLQKYDYRIKIINNKKNMGTLYSRSIGALAAKGKYIFALDNDDIFSNENLLKIIYKLAEKNNFDIVEFKSFNIPNYYPNISQVTDCVFTHHQNNLILRQPQLGLFPISKNNKFHSNDFFIWGKCIKSNIYKKAVNKLGKKRIFTYNCWTEDISIVFIIFNIAESCIFVNVYGIFHLKSNNTTTNKISNNHRLITLIYLLDILFDFLGNNYESKKFAVEMALKRIPKINFQDSNEEQKLYIKSVFIKLLNCEFIVEKDKMDLQNKFNLSNIISNY